MPERQYKSYAFRKLYPISCKARTWVLLSEDPGSVVSSLRLL